jgi:hypothetical protein
MYLTAAALAYGLYRKIRHDETKLSGETEIIYNVLQEKGFFGCQVGTIIKTKTYLSVTIGLSSKKTNDDLLKILPKLVDDLGALDAKIEEKKGRWTTILFGINDLSHVIFKEDMLHDGTLKIYLPTAYGEMTLDFEDGASCHLLNGGATRMGKTKFLLYTLTSLYVQTKGSMKLHISSAKIKDFYPFFRLPNVTLSMDEEQAMEMLESVIAEYKRRSKLLLHHPDLRKVADAKGVKNHALNHYHEFSPIFVCIDEVARLAENKELMKMLEEIAETAGYVNVHLILASQRPDASTVMKPRLKANILTRLAFTTGDTANSKIILDREGAEKLGGIAGRGLLLDGDTFMVQIPFMDDSVAEQLLAPFEDKTKGLVLDDEKGQSDSALSERVQGLLKKSVSLPDLQ